MELALRTLAGHAPHLRRRQLQRGCTQRKDDSEPGNKFVDDPIHDFGGQAFDKETFALRWTPGAQKVNNFPPPGAGGVSGFLLKAN